MTKAKVGALRPGQKAALWVLPLLFAFAALCIGRIRLPPAEVLRSILAKLGLGAAAAGQTEQILWTMRFPRVLLALLVGAGLSVAGCAFQSLFSNPLATPDTLGVASGASFGAALGILLGLGLTGIQLTALAFGVSAVALTYLSGMRVRARQTEKPALAIGQKAAYFTGTDRFVNIVEDGGLHGFGGIRKLAALLEEAAAVPKDTRRLIQIKGLGCSGGCCG